MIDIIKKCKKCNLHKGRTNAVAGDWNPRAKIMFIGIAPGRLGGDKTGIPFTKDKSGRFFRELLNKNNISQDIINVTNLVRCNPRDSNGKNRDPSHDEIKKCLRIWPQDNDTEGFFIAKIRKG